MRIYQYNGSSWQQLGTDINGDRLVSLSADGSTVAIGPYSGLVRVYQYDGSSWQQLSTDIRGGEDDGFGSSPSLSADGSTIAIGAHGNGFDSGHVRVYQLTQEP